MPRITDVEGESGSSTTPAKPGTAPLITGQYVPVVIDQILDCVAGALAGGSGALQVFSARKVKGTHILMKHSGGTGVMYIGYFSDVSSTKHLYALVAGSDPVEIPIGPAVPLYVCPDGAGNNYTACHVRKRSL